MNGDLEGEQALAHPTAGSHIIPAPLGDAAHVKVDYEGDHAQGHHLDAGHVPDQQAVTDRHAAAHAPEHD